MYVNSLIFGGKPAVAGKTSEHGDFCPGLAGAWLGILVNAESFGLLLGIEITAVAPTTTKHERGSRPGMNKMQCNESKTQSRRIFGEESHPFRVLLCKGKSAL